MIRPTPPRPRAMIGAAVQSPGRRRTAVWHGGPVHRVAAGGDHQRVVGQGHARQAREHYCCGAQHRRDTVRRAPVSPDVSAPSPLDNAGGLVRDLARRLFPRAGAHKGSGQIAATAAVRLHCSAVSAASKTAELTRSSFARGAAKRKKAARGLHRGNCISCTVSKVTSGLVVSSWG